MRSSSHMHQARDSLTQPTLSILERMAPRARHPFCKRAPSSGPDSEDKDVISVVRGGTVPAAQLPAAQHVTGSTWTGIKAKEGKTCKIQWCEREHPALLSASCNASICPVGIGGGCHKMSFCCCAGFRPSQRESPGVCTKLPDPLLFGGCSAHTPPARSSAVLPPCFSSSPLCQ